MDCGSFWVVYVNKSTEILKITIFTSIWEDDILSFEHKYVISQRKTNINIQINQILNIIDIKEEDISDVQEHIKAKYKQVICEDSDIGENYE